MIDKGRVYQIGEDMPRLCGVSVPFQRCSRPAVKLISVPGKKEVIPGVCLVDEDEPINMAFQS